MARVRLKRKRYVIPEKYVLVILTVLCVGFMVLTYTTDIVSSLLSGIAGYTIIPFQNGLTEIGSGINGRMEDLKEVKTVLSENEALKSKVAELEQKNNELTADRYELSGLRELFQLNMEYPDYEKIGARVTGKDPGNWYSVFVVDKGTSDGVGVDMNVIAGAGLVGIVTKVGPNWAQVRSIIDDSSNVSGMVLSTADNLMVMGNLQSMQKGDIDFSQLSDSDGNVAVGDKVVTSDISDRYLPGISIGYISSIKTDPNNLTKSGKITPLVDFEHLDVVLIITRTKETADETDN
ncbi:MAG: rod shape-determining protein MreC [Lachnospiraceae bacterium]|nr:rod shape-determining protein MreC [Lachnospiraceae bacterium]